MTQQEPWCFYLRKPPNRGLNLKGNGLNLKHNGLNLKLNGLSLSDNGLKDWRND
jgi:hypothetical protein